MDTVPHDETAFPVHTAETAPAEAQGAMRDLDAAFGFTPNIAGAMATSPVLIRSLTAVFGQVHHGSFGEADIQTLLLTNAVTNRAHWAVAFHSALALKEGLDEREVAAMRAGRSPDHPRRGALSTLARRLIETRGRIGAAAQAEFLAAGFSPEELLEAVAVSAASTITNYTANVTQPPLEAAFREFAWAG